MTNNNSLSTKAIRRFDRAGSLRPAAILFAGLAMAAGLEAALAFRQSRSLSLVFVGLALGWALLACDLAKGDDRRPLRSRPLPVAMFLTLLLATKGLLVSDRSASAWPTVGLVLLIGATALVMVSSRYGLAWYGGRALFVVFGAGAALELLMNVFRTEGTALLASLVRLGVVGALAYVAFEEGQMLYRSWKLFRRRLSGPTGSVG